VEDVPPEHRQTVQNAMASAGTLTGHSKITVNGVGYDSLEAMPPDARRTYEQALEKAKAVARRTGAALPGSLSGAPAQEGGISPRTITILIILAALALLVKHFAPH